MELAYSTKLTVSSLHIELTFWLVRSIWKYILPRYCIKSHRNRTSLEWWKHSLITHASFFTPAWASIVLGTSRRPLLVVWWWRTKLSSIRIPPWNLNKPRWNNHLCVTWMPWPPRACNERARSWQGPVCYSPLVRMLNRRGCSLSRWINRTTYRNHRIRQFWMVKLTCHPKLALASSYIIGTFLFIRPKWVSQWVPLYSICHSSLFSRVVKLAGCSKFACASL